ncbi:MAG: hypothetical protein ACMXYB_01405 [Candidatus Woesearchaeota archaeon]
MVLKNKTKKNQGNDEEKSTSKIPQKVSKENKIIKAKDKNEEEKEGIREYLIIFGGALLFFIIIYFAFEYFDDREQKTSFSIYNEMGILDKGFIYQTRTFGGAQANVEFALDRKTLEEFNFRQDVTNDWFKLNTNIRIATPDILENRTENALLIKTSGKFASFLTHIQGIRLNEFSFFTINNLTSCKQSSENNSLIIYNYIAGEIGVIIPEEFPHCVLINANFTAVDFTKAVDKIMFDTIISG